MTDYNELISEDAVLDPDDVIKLIAAFEGQIENLKLQQKVGIIDEDGVRDEINMISQKQKALKVRLVSEKHVTSEGVPRTISYHEATPGNPKDYYVTKQKDKGKNL